MYQPIARPSISQTVQPGCRLRQSTAAPIFTVYLVSQPAPPEQDAAEGEAEEPSSTERQDEIDEVDEASRESFPASDPPAFTPLHIGS